MKQFPCIESTLDITLGSRTIRLWINRKDIPENSDLLEYEKQIIKNWLLPKREFLLWASELPNINAIQLLERVGDIKYGTVVYTVPFEDVHG